MVECDECEEPCKRRTRCKGCGELRCGYCLHHFHNIDLSHARKAAADKQRDEGEK